jgi:hydroxymethylglutaryl-CoA synthase
MPDVGIDAIGFYSSSYFLDLKTLAQKRGVDPDKYSIGLGQHRMAVPPPGEDIVTMAANAAARVLVNENLENIDHLLFATESGLDFSKAAGIYVHKLLGLSSRCRVLELKQACYSATAAIQLALPILRENTQRKILVIAADIARYGLNTVGESSQGGGAIAMLLSANPRILAFEPISGIYTKDVMDFWRPYYREEALVDGKYSCDVYLQVLLETWAQYSEAAQRSYGDFSRFCYHAPVPGLVEKAHKWLAKRNNISLEKAQLQEQLAHPLHYNRNIGNSYTASLYVSLLSLLDNDPEDLSGQLIGLYSYGSGCVGEFFAGKVQPGYRQYLNSAENQALIKNRTELSYDQYQNFYTFPLPVDGSDCVLPKYSSGRYRLAKISQHKRCYEEVAAAAENFTAPSYRAKTMEQTHLTVRTPGKLILSGEHAVVYGNPALAMAINCYTDTTISGHIQAGQQNILFNLLNFRYHQEHSLSTLRRFKLGIQDKYQKFLQGQYGIRDVLKEPFELMQFAVTHFIDKRKVNLPQGIEVRTTSNIPVGCGMGSSAAAVVSSMFAVARFSRLEIDLESCYQLAWEAENMQHGHSSGVDVYLVLHGGCVRFQKGAPNQSRPVPLQQFILVNTGPPAATTGECVTAAAKFLKNDAKLLADFEQVTNDIDIALQQNNSRKLMESIGHNHRLLTQIGVVPEKVQRFIAEIEKTGGAAKICGAGSVHGDSAGVVLVVADQDISHIVQNYQYQQLSIQGELQGTRVL